MIKKQAISIFEVFYFLKTKLINNKITQKEIIYF